MALNSAYWHSTNQPLSSCGTPSQVIRSGKSHSPIRSAPSQEILSMPAILSVSIWQVLLPREIVASVIIPWIPICFSVNGGTFLQYVTTFSAAQAPSDGSRFYMSNSSSGKYTHLNTCLHTYLHTCIPTPMYLFTYTPPIHVHIHTCTHAYMYTSTHVHTTNTCTYPYTYTSIHVHIHTRTHPYTYTSIHVHIHRRQILGPGIPEVQFSELWEAIAQSLQTVQLRFCHIWARLSRV